MDGGTYISLRDGHIKGTLVFCYDSYATLRSDGISRVGHVNHSILIAFLNSASDILGNGSTQEVSSLKKSQRGAVSIAAHYQYLYDTATNASLRYEGIQGKGHGKSYANVPGTDASAIRM